MKKKKTKNPKSRYLIDSGLSSVAWVLQFTRKVLQFILDVLLMLGSSVRTGRHSRNSFNFSLTNIALSVSDLSSQCWHSWGAMTLLVFTSTGIILSVGKRTAARSIRRTRLTLPNSFRSVCISLDNVITLFRVREREQMPILRWWTDCKDIKINWLGSLFVKLY